MILWGSRPHPYSKMRSLDALRLKKELCTYQLQGRYIYVFNCKELRDKKIITL